MIRAKSLKNGRIVYTISAKLILTKNGKRNVFTVKQNTKTPTALYTTWKLSRTTLKSILKRTNPSDWLFRKVEWFDGTVDSILPVDSDFHPMTPHEYNFVLEDITGYWDSRYSGIYYLQDKNAIEVFHLSLGRYLLKPANPDMLQLEIQKRYQLRQS